MVEDSTSNGVLLALASSEDRSASTKSNKGSKFMNWFWDLASDDGATRAHAALMILKFVQLAQSNHGKQDELCADLDYSVKRLTRGLSSSRQSARQGFAACLSAILTHFELVQTKEVIDLIEKTTQSNTAMKGSEERDLFFGKLFGYMTLARAHRFQAHPSFAVDAINSLLSVYERKPWSREVIAEAILSLIHEVKDDSTVLRGVLATLSRVVSGHSDDMDANQIMLLIGMQNHFEVHSAGDKEHFESLFPYKRVSSLKRIGKLTAALLAACASFPTV
jgi:DNA polymerase phi